MTTKMRKIAPSAQFRIAADELAKAMSQVLTSMDQRDNAEVEVQTLRAQLAAAEARLTVYERRFEMTREMLEPQQRLHLSMMETEAKANIAELRSVPA